MISFSVIIPVFQAEKYIKRCLESLLRQSYTDFEVLMIDDGSTDRSYDICRSYQNKDRRFQVVHQENRGVSDARNQGLKLAVKEYVIFVDADDYVTEQYLELLNRAIKDKPDICISTRYYIVEKNQIHLTEGILFAKSNAFHSKEDLLEGIVSEKINPPYAVWLNSYRRQFLLENKIVFDPAYSHGEDADFFLQALFSVKTYCWLEDAGYFYNRDNEASATYTVNVKLLKSHLEFRKKWYYQIMTEYENYAGWARQLSDFYHYELIEGECLSKKERKEIFEKDRESIGFYLGTPSRWKRIVIRLYLIFGYENLVPVIAFLFRMKQSLLGERVIKS